MRGVKVVTSDYRPPIRGGDPIWDGTPGFVLPKVALDRGREECSYGWNFCLDPVTAVRIGGLWPDGRPAVLLHVETVGDYVERGDKCRAESLRILGPYETAEVHDVIARLSVVFAPHADDMAAEQLAWYEALGRPRRNLRDVEQGLRRALAARGLSDWRLQRFDSSKAVWDAWDARATRDAWDAWDARDTQAARDAWVAWDAWAARDARDARDAWAARDAWDAWDAWAALTVHFAGIQDWIDDDPALLTTGIRDAYEAGLELAIPSGPNELGYVMRERAA